MSLAPVVPRTLYHYTCREHGAPGIQRSGTLRPRPHPLLNRYLVWLTDLETPDRWALGLTSITLCCDRTQARVTVHPHGDAAGRDAVFVVPWWFYARQVPAVLREIMEDTGLPMHWWVCERAIPATGMIATSVLLGKSNG